MKNKNLNAMCNDCRHLGKNCSGETSQLYSGCVWKNATDKGLDAFNKTAEEVTEKGRRRTEYLNKKDAAREEAQEWQANFSSHNYSYDDLAQATAHFKKLGKRYGLLSEFKENGIL